MGDWCVGAGDVYFAGVIFPAGCVALEAMRFHCRRAGFELLALQRGVTLSGLRRSFDDATVLFVADIEPLAPVYEVENARIFLLHKVLRKVLPRRQSIAVTKQQSFAKQLVRRLLSQSECKNMFDYIGGLAADYQSDPSTLKMLANGYCNKTEIILRGKTKMVRKTYRHWQMSCLQRELDAREGLAHLPEMSPIIKEGGGGQLLCYSLLRAVLPVATDRA